MYLAGFLYLLLGYDTGLGIVVNIIMAVGFHSLYKDHVKDRVAEIKSDNPNLSQEQLCELLHKKGGTSLAIPILIGIINTVIVTLVLVFVFGTIDYIDRNYNSNYSYNDDYDNISNSNSNKNEKYEDPASIESLQITVPDDFEKTTSISDISYINNDGTYIHIGVRINENTSIPRDYKKVEINNHIWYQKDVSSHQLTHYKYQTTFEGSTFNVRFYCSKDKNKNCTTILE